MRVAKVLVLTLCILVAISGCVLMLLGLGDAFPFDASVSGLQLQSAALPAGAFVAIVGVVMAAVVAKLWVIRTKETTIQKFSEGALVEVVTETEMLHVINHWDFLKK